MTSKTFCCNLVRTVLCAFLAFTVLTPSVSFGQNTYRILARWTIGGEGGWDYLTVDAPMHHLYVTHGTRLEVLDTVSGKVVGSIAGMKGLHGVALDDAGKFGYISDGGANSVVVFDRASLQTVATIPAG